MTLTKEYIVGLLATNDKALSRALILLNDRQTATEQTHEATINQNGRGFRPCHARMGTSMAKFFQKYGYLSPKQKAYWRKPMKGGQMRIGIYWAQLVEEANTKAAMKERVQEKTEFARLEAEQERRAFMNDPDMKEVA